jgi:hypothetical protein
MALGRANIPRLSLGNEVWIHARPRQPLNATRWKADEFGHGIVAGPFASCQIAREVPKKPPRCDSAGARLYHGSPVAGKGPPASLSEGPPEGPLHPPVFVMIFQ